MAQKSKGEKSFVFGPELSVVLLIAGLGLLAWSYSIQPMIGEEEGSGDGAAAICIDCIVGSVGGGCTYVDEETGETIQPLGCFQQDPSVERVFCTDEQKAAEVCTLEYAPVCGSDAREYGNKCQACASPTVFYYLQGTCDEALIEE